MLPRQVVHFLNHLQEPLRHRKPERKTTGLVTPEPVPLLGMGGGSCGLGRGCVPTHNITCVQSHESTNGVLRDCPNQMSRTAKIRHKMLPLAKMLTNFPVNKP